MASQLTASPLEDELEEEAEAEEEVEKTLEQTMKFYLGPITIVGFVRLGKILV